MAKFTIKRKGYSIEEVDGFIAKLFELTEAKLSEQSRRIDELKTQVRALNAEKKEWKAKENSVSLALSEAVRRADELDGAAEVRYSLELQRIRHYRKRFSDYLERVKTKAPIDKEVLEFDGFMANLENELSELMQRELNMEKSVLPDRGTENVAETRAEANESENGFDLQEALTPKETLEDICRELGLI